MGCVPRGPNAGHARCPCARRAGERLERSHQPEILEDRRPNRGEVASEAPGLLVGQSLQPQELGPDLREPLGQPSLASSESVEDPSEHLEDAIVEIAHEPATLLLPAHRPASRTGGARSGITGWRSSGVRARLARHDEQGCGLSDRDVEDLSPEGRRTKEGGSGPVTASWPSRCWSRGASCLPWCRRGDLNPHGLCAH
jgi:hypothetical protein